MTQEKIRAWAEVKRLRRGVRRTLALGLVVEVLPVICITLYSADLVSNRFGVIALGLCLFLGAYGLRHAFREANAGEIIPPNDVKLGFLLEDTKRLATELGVRMPEVRFLGARDDDGNLFGGPTQAFTYPSVIGSHVLFVGLGLLELLEREQLRAVLAHELGHMSRGQALMRRCILLLRSGMDGGLFVLFGAALAAVMLRLDQGNFGFEHGLAACGLFFFLTVPYHTRRTFALGMASLKHQEELLCDAVAAFLVGAKAMIESRAAVVDHHVSQPAIEVRMARTEMHPLSRATTEEQFAMLRRIEGDTT